MKTTRTVQLFAALAVVATAASTLPFATPAALALSGSDRKSDVQLVATGVDADARGRAKLRVKSADDGRFEIRANGLEPGATYQIVFSDVAVEELVADENGRIRARLRSRPRSSTDGLLGFDPRGSILLVRNAAGEDVLAGDLPAGGNASDDSKIVCCVPDDDGTECEDRTTDECTAEGGTVSTATTCLPNPCDTVTVPTEDDVICCLPDDSGPECEDRTVEECSAQGGIVVAADSCLDNPCAAVPSVDDDTRCCEPDDSGNDCEDRLPAECMARGGVDIGAGICAIDSCEGVVIPTGNEELRIRCEKRDSRSRADVDASGLRDGAYTARLVSGASEAVGGPLTATLGQAEFDFDSDGGDIAAGATAIPAAFITGSPASVFAQILDAGGNVVLEGSANCEVR